MIVVKGKLYLIFLNLPFHRWILLRKNNNSKVYLIREWKCNLDQVNEFKKGCSFIIFFFEINTHARDFKINPSLRTLRLLSFKVFPVDVISVIISDDPTKGYVSVAPRLGTSLY